MELLTNVDIENLAKSLRIPLRHIGYKDTFTMKPQDGAYIINLQSKIGNTGGSHWTAMVFKRRHVAYFDPFGLPVPMPIRAFILRYKPTRAIYSLNGIQAMPSVLCGYFSLYFLYFITVKHKRCDRLGFLINLHNAIYHTDEDTDKTVQRLFRQLFFG